MRDPLKAFLESSGTVILDGGLATELERRGADLHDELWSAKMLLEAPEMIRQVHFDYFVAGADLATSASYQATAEGFRRRGIEAEQAADLMRLSVRLAQEAREQFWSDSQNRTGRHFPLVAASLGCYGAYLADGSEYRGDYDLNATQLVEFHRPRIEILASGKPDLLAFETIPCLVEAEAIVQVLHEFPQWPAWISFSCRDPQSVWHGERLADCVAVVEKSPQVVAVGINCTAPEHIDALLASLCGKTSKPILVYPNSGQGWDAERKVWLPRSQQINWREAASRWRRAGAAGVGGCCQTSPETIREISRA